MASPSIISFASALLLIAGCSLDTSATLPPGASDSGTDTGTGPGDSSMAVDSGSGDADVRDSGVMDSGAMDSGRVDTGTPDTGTPDTGTPDTGPPPTCSELFSDDVPGYEHCGGTPTTECDLKFGHGFDLLSSANCNDICAAGSMTCVEMYRRPFLATGCDRESSTVGCGTDEHNAVCICAP
ncbi:MAG: hypothetical protein DRJ42_17280 [Deltaproteobacteria bacterium]|nr:MAG: hypothetical protein DRJ42_17280 [Deltaproteobacteria bacterium]